MKKKKSPPLNCVLYPHPDLFWGLEGRRGPSRSLHTLLISWKHFPLSSFSHWLSTWYIHSPWLSRPDPHSSFFSSSPRHYWHLHAWGDPHDLPHCLHSVMNTGATGIILETTISKLIRISPLERRTSSIIISDIYWLFALPLFHLDPLHTLWEGIILSTCNADLA